ncbi:DUF6520 family protein [Flavivirga amylovorans]|uniref:DUF6520 family protein n=1 Tax=Flavivirga amylovorans TaxID=870486 RepID=A0ABT8X6A5_9FLAO|nr:DUF6520 family protein [Flavivirga amylovorans]MDO5989531.1 DUF6520 family protein [Flavivirga amylovorans]
MKSNFFKIVLPAFALMLAITASLAFTTNDDFALEQAYIPSVNQQGQDICDESIMCSDIDNGQECTIGLGTPIQVFGLQTVQGVTKCTKTLWKP